MTPAMRVCLDCGKRHRHDGPRCWACYSARERARNATRTQYAGRWRATSRRARHAVPYCAMCGTTADLTLDHEHGQVECRSCNSAHRRNPE